MELEISSVSHFSLSFHISSVLFDSLHCESNITIILLTNGASVQSCKPFEATAQHQNWYWSICSLQGCHLSSYVLRVQVGGCISKGTAGQTSI
jgi:hypothetical protein